MIFEDDYTYITRKIRSDSAFVLLERDIDLNNPVSIRNDSLVIDGNGYTINANGKTRIFNITGGNIVLKNFIFKNGNASADIPDDGGFGGVIRNESHLKLENCLFFNNEAEKDGNDIINHGELEISDCMFSRNSSNHSIFNLGSIKISENQFESIKPLINGGEVSLLSESPKVESVKVETVPNFKYLDDLIHSGEKTICLNSDIYLASNEAYDYIHGIPIDVDDITIKGNGHAVDADFLTRIFSVSGKNITIENLNFVNGYSSSRSKEEVPDSNYRTYGSTRGYGGAIYNRGELKLIDCSFSQNNSLSFGGAIANMYGLLKIMDCNFSYNSAYNGGAIFSKSKLEIENTAFSHNGGPLYERENLQKPALSFKDYTRYGGAILNEDQLVMSNCDFKYNYARHGGAINNFYSGDLKASMCMFSRNASKFVGAINNYKGEIEIADSAFINNIPLKEWGRDSDIFDYFDVHIYAGRKPQICIGAIRNEGVANLNGCKFISDENFPKSIENVKRCLLNINESYFSRTRRDEIKNRGYFKDNDCVCGCDEFLRKEMNL